MTLSDSQAMKMPPPIISDMSCILVSKKRLIAVLVHLGFIDETFDGQNLLAMIHLLWKEANEYTNGGADVMTTASNESNYNAVGKPEEEKSNVTALMDSDSEYVSDLIQLGTLKWILYGFPAKQPSWFSSFCMPCGMTPAEKALHDRQGPKAQQDHPVQTSCMKRRHGELVRHDVMICKICRIVTGCSHANEGSDVATSSDQVTPLPVPISQQRSTSLSMREGPNFRASDDQSIVDSTCESVVEVSTIASLMAGDMQMVDSYEERVRV